MEAGVRLKTFSSNLVRGGSCAQVVESENISKIQKFVWRAEWWETENDVVWCGVSLKRVGTKTRKWIVAVTKECVTLVVGACAWVRHPNI